ncbi:ABC transporter permease subunit [Lentibacillus sediminis]|uniref:ABC transporter permease subunit n=1 Tax=Lentibacillus sediminis TaxID=1940529 RepID=UPI0013045226|nr:ABC transporter permease [Lentibacillus sediminis]
MQLFKFEFKKNWRKKQFVILSLLVLLFVSGMFFRNVWMQSEIGNNAEQFMVTPHAQHVLSLENELREQANDNPDDEILQAQFANVQEMSASFHDLQNALQNDQWGRVPKLEYQFLDTVQTHLESGGDFPSFEGEELSQRLEKNAILIMQQLPYEDANYSLQSANFMKIAASALMSFNGVLLLVFLLGGTLSEEFDQRTISTLYTQPFKKWSVVLGKYASMMASTLFFLSIFLTASFVLPLAYGEDIGSFAYPQLVILEDGFEFITILEYIGKLLFLFIGSASFAFSLALLISLLFRNRFSTLILTLLVLLCGNLLTGQIGNLQAVWNPFYYFSFTERIEQPEGHFVFAGLLFVYTFLILILCYWIQKKQISLQMEAHKVSPYHKGKTIKQPTPLKAMLLFEWRKLWRQGLVKQLLVIFVLMVVGGYVLIFFQSNEREQEFLQRINGTINVHEDTIIPTDEERLQEAKKVIQQLEKKQTLDRMEEMQLERAQTTAPAVEQSLKYSHSYLMRTKEMLAAYHEENWKTYYDYWIYQNRLWKGEIQFEDQIFQPSVTTFTFNTSIAEKEILAERNLEPVLPSEYMYTIYESFPNRLDEMEWKRETQKIDTTGLFYLYTFFDLFIYLVPLGLLVFLFGFGFAAETGKKRTLDFLKTQPISKGRMFTGKAAVSITAALGITIGLMACMVLLGTAGDRFGDWAFPVLHYDATEIAEVDNYDGLTSLEGGFHFITMGSYLVETGLLVLASLLFLLVLSLVFSLFTRNTVTTFILTVFVAAGGYFLATSVGEIAHYLPFTYLNAGKIANGELATVLNNSDIQPWLGMSVLAVSSILLLGGGLAWFRK